MAAEVEFTHSAFTELAQDFIVLDDATDHSLR
jgi:hypothetical protein